MKFNLKAGFSVAVGLFSLAVQGCNGVADPTGEVQGQDEAVHAPLPLPNEQPKGNSPAPLPPVPVPPAGSGNTPALGVTCVTSDADHLCLGMKFVVYVDSNGAPVMTQDTALSDLSTINSIWSQCNIGFQFDEYLTPDPTGSGLIFNTANMSELDQIRKVFMDSETLLMVTTGKWDRSGTLGSTGANAWANMPGDGLYGVVLESAVGDYGNIYAHELGHYLNLPHVSDSSDVMNAVIYGSSTKLTTSQCATARNTAISYWTKMLR